MSDRIRQAAEAAIPYATTHGADAKAWAKRFVYRYEKGDKTLLPVQVQFAYMALGMDPPIAEKK